MTDESSELQGFAAAVEAAKADIGDAPSLPETVAPVEATGADQATADVLEHSTADASDKVSDEPFMFADVIEDITPNPFNEGGRTTPISEEFVEVKAGEDPIQVSELVQGYLRQADYTQKTQLLADERKSFEAENEAAVSLVESLRQDPAGTIASLAVSVGLMNEADLDPSVIANLNREHSVPTRESVAQSIETQAKAMVEQDPRVIEAEDARLLAEVEASFSQIEATHGVSFSGRDKDAIFQRAVEMGTMRVDLAFLDLQAQATKLRKDRDAAKQSAPQAPGAAVADQTPTQPSTPPTTVKEAWQRAKATSV